ncbi:Imm44 family immunity protein [Defluviitalea phaphyphila]|uniref:Imm44 family immunity protein n=1 Tax=Defluviitalea phaphyphila TaxID=1473580 RepID=UPI0007301C15|nr:Imm44 family immunity protein [Defluviitalea phaphyphila]
MRLNINSPAYYSKQFGIENEIYNMCRGLSNFVRDKEYSSIVDTIGIVPIIAPKDEIEAGKWREEKIYDIKHKFVFISKQINYEEYCNSDIETRKKLIIKNILDSVRSIHKKAKFDYKKFENDIKEFVTSYIEKI